MKKFLILALLSGISFTQRKRDREGSGDEDENGDGDSQETIIGNDDADFLAFCSSYNKSYGTAVEF